jgi:hypothetical protein
MLRHLFNSRVEIIRLNLDMSDGVPNQSWDKVPFIIDPRLGVPGEMMCRLDLTFQRPGKDQPMPVVAGRAPDRVGIMFYDVTNEVRSGDRIRCLSGPVSGTFEMRVNADPAVGFGDTAHHMEVQVVEVAQNTNPNFLSSLDR